MMDLPARTMHLMLQATWMGGARQVYIKPSKASTRNTLLIARNQFLGLSTGVLIPNATSHPFQHCHVSDLDGWDE